jgi:phosphatidate cytidylyltransferase
LRGGTAPGEGASSREGAPLHEGAARHGASAPPDRVRPAQGLIVRVATALLGIPLTVLLIVLGIPWLVVGIAGVTVIGLLEFYRMAEKVGYRPVRTAGLVAGVLFALAAAAPSSWEFLIVPGLLVYTMLVQVQSPRLDRGLANAGVTLLGALYVGYLFSYMIRLRTLPIGPAHAPSPFPALLVMCVVWAADSAAYFVGVAAGRHKLLPRVSPNKSLEGAAAAVLAGIAAGILFARLSGLPLAMSGVVGALCASVAIIGDLWESAIKREAGVKDAGWVLPGHGGVLDRFDGLLFAAATGYAVMLWWPRA